MLKVLENLNNNELISSKLGKEIANLIIDKDYDYSIKENVCIPDTINHTANIMNNMLSNTFLNKNCSISFLDETFFIFED